MSDKNIEFEQFVNEILDLSGEIALKNFRKIRALTLKEILVLLQKPTKILRSLLEV